MGKYKCSACEKTKDKQKDVSRTINGKTGLCEKCARDERRAVADQADAAAAAAAAAKTRKKKADAAAAAAGHASFEPRAYRRRHEVELLGGVNAVSPESSSRHLTRSAAFIGAVLDGDTPPDEPLAESPMLQALETYDSGEDESSFEANKLALDIAVGQAAVCDGLLAENGGENGNDDDGDAAAVAAGALGGIATSAPNKGEQAKIVGEILAGLGVKLMNGRRHSEVAERDPEIVPRLVAAANKLATELVALRAKYHSHEAAMKVLQDNGLPDFHDTA